MVGASAFLLLVSTAAPGLVRSAGARAPVRNILVATDRTEPTIVVNGRDSRNLVVGSNPDYDERNPAGFSDGHSWSFTGGNTWSGGEMPLLRPWTTEADPSLAAGSHGAIYYAYLGEASSYCTDGASAVLMSRSTDGGRTFSAPIIVDAGSGLHDKPWVAVRSSRHGADQVFVTWDRPLKKGSQVFIQRSTDGGRSFGRPQLLEQSPWLNYGSMPVVGPSGRVTVVWASFPHDVSTKPMPERIVARTSFDDGHTWGAKVSPSRGYFTDPPSRLNPGDLRVLSSPAAVVTGTGRTFVAWTRVRHAWPDGSATTDIMLAKSWRGRHWSRAVTVNDVHRRDRFMPTIAVLAKHVLGVAFYDRRDGYNNLAVYASRVTTSWRGIRPGANFRLTQGTAPVDLIRHVPSATCLEPGRFFGDYIASAADGYGYFHVVWADTQRHKRNVTDLFTASVPLRK